MSNNLLDKLGNKLLPDCHRCLALFLGPLPTNHQSYRFLQQQHRRSPAGTGKEVDALIGSQTRDEKAIEHMIDCLFDLAVYVGIGEKLFLRLLDYYKTVNPKAADWRWQEYEAEKEKRSCSGTK